ncbi:MAG TPA: hypothetical protein DE060_19720 [Lentisphaeria bacterium]|nr:hypothetical protein [Lentisphaeria bacterium]HCG51418.1 hypothetical protein [Lentisphaeria bacterium]
MAKIKFSSCLSAFMKNQRSALCVFFAIFSSSFSTFSAFHWKKWTSACKLAVMKHNRKDF